MKEENIITKYALAGQSYDIMQALELLTKAYIAECGISLGFRSLVYYAAERWMEKLAWLDLPLSEMARKEALVTLMPHITSDYDPDVYDDYDIIGLSDEELLESCVDAIMQKEFGQATLEVLCWGVNDYLTTSEEPLSIEIESTAKDGTILKGIIEEQQCSGTTVRMTYPYQDIVGIKSELIRDGKEILEAIYEDYNRLTSSREMAEQLYEKYKEELCHCQNKSKFKIHFMFDKIFEPLLEDTPILACERILTEKFGMEFYDSFKEKYPSWYKDCK